MYPTFRWFGLAAASLSLIAVPVVVAADDSSNENQISHTYPNAEGAYTETGSIVINSGDAPVAITWPADRRKDTVGPTIDFGSSYARSTETMQFFYRGTARAGGNVNQGTRIVGVTIRYTRDGETVGDGAVTSRAGCNGSSWTRGAEAVTSATDTLNPVANKTQFTYSLSRISTGTRCFQAAR